jgi:hypothetical protein
MNQQIWKNVGRWLVAIVVCVSGLMVAFVALMFAVIVVPRTCIRWADAIHFHMPADIFVSLLSLLAVAAGIAVWAVPSVFAIGFALDMPVRSRWRWGFSVCLLLTAVLRWFAPSAASTFAPHIFILASGAVLIGGIVWSFRHLRGPRIHFLANVAALFVLTLPCWIAFAIAPPQPPTARKLWSVTLQKNTWLAMNTGSESNATRQAVFAGDRILVVFDAGYPRYQGKQPISTYRLVSLDVKTGSIKNSVEFTGRWGNMPTLYATNDGHAILDDGSVTSLNPDLTTALPQSTFSHGRVEHMSPDGSTFAWETFPGTTLIDSRSLMPLGKPLNESLPSSVSRQAVVTGNHLWIREYPNDHSFITLTDESGQHLIFHSRDFCAGQPEFLTNETIYLTGCGTIRILGVQGRILREAPFYEGWGPFAGVSQNGKRFALHRSEERGDPEVLLYEHFVIYDVDTLAPVSIVRISELPEHQSWSAFSPDGHLFVAGSPDDLTLYQLP